MRWHKYYPYLFSLVLLISLCLRLPDLALRPLHTDEAVHAVKFGTLVERGTYIYDPHEYHGPTLYYFTLLSSSIGSIKSFQDLSEFSLRIIPVIAGFITLLSLVFLYQGLNRKVLLLSILFLAISPAVVYYNRYYIHETLLVLFSIATIASGYYYIQKRNLITAILTGLFLGLMVSTKETWVIFIMAMAAALLLTFNIRELIKSVNLSHLIIMLFTAGAVVIILYTSFLTNPEGIWSALISYKNYLFERSSIEIHNHPWYYYLSLLLFFKNGSFPFWSEGILLVLFVIGMFFVIRKKTTTIEDSHLLKFIIIYTISLIIILSLIPYKTPWNLLGFMPGIAIVSAFAVVELFQVRFTKIARIVFLLFLIIGSIHLLWQSINLNYVYYASPANPYVYAHTGTDVFYINEEIEKVAQAHPEGHDLYIQVIASEDDYWPLPWYLRHYNRIGWWDNIPADTPAASLIILTADLESKLIDKLYEQPPPGQRELYLPLFNRYTELRPGIEYRGYIKKADWDLMQSSDIDLELYKSE